MSDPAIHATPYAPALLAGLKPPPAITVSQWADQHRQLGGSTSAEPGQWRTDRTPYLREIMDNLSARSDVERTVVMKAAQLGGSECLYNWLGYIIENSPGPTMIVMPTVETAQRTSKTRLAPMLSGTPSVAALIAAPHSRDSSNTVLLKEFRGGVLAIVGANSGVGLRSMPVRYLLLDEVDAYPPDAAGEGDPIDLAMARTTTYHDRRVCMVSTPTIKGLSAIERAYYEGDQRQYEVPCPHCGAYQPLVWAGLVWPEGRPRHALYRCAHCEQTFSERHKEAMLASGRWVATAPGDGRTRSYKLNALYAPLGWAASWGALAAEFLQKKKDPLKLRVFVNTRLAETWEEESSKLNWTTLSERAEAYEQAPPEVLVVTAGVDVQADRLEVEIVGWGVNEESWSLDYKAIPGDTSGPVPWAVLDKLLLTPVVFADPRRAPLAIAACAVDTGFNTLSAYAFCRDREQRRVWPIKGRAGPLPAWPKAPSRKNKGRVPLYIIGADSIKFDLYGRLAQVIAGPGYCHFPAARSPEYFRQLTSEQFTEHRKRGHIVREWTLRQGQTRNEALDCRVYATAALHGLISLGLRLDEIQPQAQGPKAAQANQQGRKDGGDWLGGSQRGPRKPGSWL